MWFYICSFVYKEIGKGSVELTNFGIGDVFVGKKR